MRKLILSGEYCNYTLSKKSAKLYRLTRQPPSKNELTCHHVFCFLKEPKCQSSYSLPLTWLQKQLLSDIAKQ